VITSWESGTGVRPAYDGMGARRRAGRAPSYRLAGATLNSQNGDPFMNGRKRLDLLQKSVDWCDK